MGQWTKNEKIFIAMVNILEYHHIPSYCACHVQILPSAVIYAMPAICFGGELKYFTISLSLTSHVTKYKLTTKTNYK